MVEEALYSGDQNIYYSKGYKYHLKKSFSIKIQIYPKKAISTEWMTLTPTGWLTLRKGYAWNGASGPTFDSLSSMRASAVHDAIYQFIRLGLLSRGCKGIADQILHDLCTIDGMIPLRADMWEEGVHWFGTSSIDPASEPEILEAP